MYFRKGRYIAAICKMLYNRGHNVAPTDKKYTFAYFHIVIIFMIEICMSMFLSLSNVIKIINHIKFNGTKN